ncbi:MAG: heme-binding protein [Hyphomonadaceae bacterium]|nr:heme-binding protein [Hyphomonadaceae bacterium]
MTLAPASTLGATAILGALSAAEHVAEEAQTPVVIVVMDAGGRLCGQLCMPGAFLASNQYAEWKAYTAVSFSMSTPDFAAMLDRLAPAIRDGLLAHEKVTVLPGGVPILRDGVLVGAIGISGGPAELDEACAEAARLAILEAIS